MAYEAELRYWKAHPTDFIVADGTGIEKGSLLKVSDPLTAAASSAQGDALAGIAASEKIASDGRTRLAVYRKGIFDMYASGAITAGQPVMSAGAVNKVMLALTTTSGAAVLGHALETASDNEQILVEVKLD